MRNGFAVCGRYCKSEVQRDIGQRYDMIAYEF